MTGRAGAWSDRHAAYLLIAPTLLGVALVDVYPLASKPAVGGRLVHTLTIPAHHAVLCKIVP